ncbi:hypothetical protein [Pseudobutyrivibrio ruminis]|uniref:Uncharacterized protein n=1 Tax=Pseudobutyrivibrio ruminis TaxID=46206 RepID=A0A2G3E794_9FIRM|nr:hypothetical protein [Pseudobutyrivibrio ruminis]PHU34786.1 hypothetical protein CSX01_08335 [Pseudobutyrivibrio ruminis]PHU38973.1 hypothetical protein CSX00_12940 [Pseudobutyrivibrio ruminis]
MDNQITLIGAVKLLKSKDYFILTYLTKNQVKKKYEMKETVCFHTKETRSSRDAIRTGNIVLITGQIMSNKEDEDLLIINPISYHILEPNGNKKETAYLIRFGIDYNRIHVVNPTENSHFITHPIPIKDNVDWNGALSTKSLIRLSIPVFSQQKLYS